MKDLIEQIDQRFNSLNNVPVRDVRLTREEWLEIKHIMEKVKDESVQNR